MTSGPEKVSGREAQVLAALAERLSNAQIAHRLHISVRTVESHVSSLLRKFGVADRHELAALADRSVPPPGGFVGLPPARTPLVGRTGERAALLAMLEHGRLVTLLGPGGVGKTRVAAAVAEAAAAAGGAFVDLAPVGGPFVTEAVAAALGVAERPQQLLLSAVAERLNGGRQLLVLDTCEHLVDAVAGFVERLLSACPGLRVLLTSRERVGLAGEQAFPVGPLPLDSDAMRLFEDRVRAVDPAFRAEPGVVAGLCRRLEGMPLAIELAAARSGALGVAGVLAALDQPLRLLAGARGVDPRHRSIRAVIGWSHDLLDEPERVLLRRLAVFTGGFDLAAAAAVAAPGDPAGAADLLGRLVDKSLLVRQRTASGRWRMLDTVRAFALEQLVACGERAEVEGRLLEWAAATAGELVGRLTGAGAGGEDGRWRDEFDAVADDLRNALAAAPSGPGAVAHRLARALGHLTYARRFLVEAFGHHQQAASHAPDPAEAAADLITAAACAEVTTTSGPQVHGLLLAAAEHARAGGDGDVEAVALARAVELAARMPARFPVEVPYERLCELRERAAAAGNPDDPVVAARLALAAAWTASTEKFDPDPELARAALAAAEATGDPVLVSAALDAVSTAAARAGRLYEAQRLTRERFPLLAMMDRGHPHSGPEIADAHRSAAGDAVSAGDLPALLAAARLTAADELLGGHSYISACGLVVPLVLTGELDEALRYAAEMWDGWQRAGRPAAGWMLPAACTVALACALRGDRRGFLRWRVRAAEMAGIAVADLTGISTVCFVDARAAAHTGDLARAAVLVDRAFADFRGGRYRAYAWAAGAELAVMAGLPDAAERLTAAGAVAGENRWATACLARAAGRMSGDRSALAASVAGWERIGARLERAVTLLLMSDRAGEGARELADRGVAGT